MKGIEISRRFFSECGLPLLDKFPDVRGLVAAGLTGSGSECYGYDDQISRDHDFEPGFCLFLPDEDLVDRRTAFLLERAYAQLPKTFLGLERSRMNPVGGNRHGVFRLSEYLENAVGNETADLTWQQWLSLPSYRLAEAVNGEVFFDPSGFFTAAREKLARCPEDILRKKLAGSLVLMAQSGPYNYTRCLRHGEPSAAQLAAVQFVQQALQTFFLLSGRYCPYYKWAFRALRELPSFAESEADLSFLLSGDNCCPETAEEKARVIERLCEKTACALRENGLSDKEGSDLERHASRVNDGIRDGVVRSLHILSGAEVL